MVTNQLSFRKSFFSSWRCSRRRCTQTLSYWLLVGKRVWFSPICSLWIKYFSRLLENVIYSENQGVNGIFPQCDKKSHENFSCQLCRNSEKSKQEKLQPDGRSKCPVAELVPSQRKLWFLTAGSNVCTDKLLQSYSFVTFILFTLLLWEPAASTSIRLH